MLSRYQVRDEDRANTSKRAPENTSSRFWMASGFRGSGVVRGIASNPQTGTAILHPMCGTQDTRRLESSAYPSVDGPASLRGCISTAISSDRVTRIGSIKGSQFPVSPQGGFEPPFQVLGCGETNKPIFSMRKSLALHDGCVSNCFVASAWLSGTVIVPLKALEVTVLEHRDSAIMELERGYEHDRPSPDPGRPDPSA